jgi:putative spermidine/putrescine transport system permease protein
MRAAGRARSWLLAAGLFFGLFVLFLYGPMLDHRRAQSFQGPRRAGSLFRCAACRCTGSTSWSTGLGIGGHWRGLPALAAGWACVVMALTVVLSVPAGLAFRKQLRGGPCAVLRGGRPA